MNKIGWHHMDDDKRAEIAEDVDAWKREMGNQAMNLLVHSVENETMITEWTLGYFRGQLGTIMLWLDPDKLHADEALSAVYAYSKQVNGISQEKK